MQECILDQVPQLIQVLVIDALLFAILARRDMGLHALLDGQLNDGITVVALVCQEVLGVHPFDQSASLRTIRHGT